ncbi:YgaP family membrane protein [Maribacter polysaccharolyticus]|uniref:YgaP family membrane protein n=1 Tax=Maribacter polysaccharolyticus TaxID=3020831 RepID=UPI00237EEBCE|nr:DUF2892 domain-containing protein [Maribacter polysaccharolyticus]MDE3741645.1 DUF2892 domain-containing protein [Maribacter polysaccharolyticus]
MKNMGRTDKLIRVIIAIIVAVLVYFEVVTDTMAYVLLPIAAIFVLTSLVGFCPLYGIFGVNTCRKKK